VPQYFERLGLHIAEQFAISHCQLRRLWCPSAFMLQYPVWMSFN